MSTINKTESKQERENRLTLARVKKYQSKLREKGLKSRGFWVTPREAEAMRAFIEELRA